jgi:hypothetical protein
MNKVQKVDNYVIRGGLDKWKKGLLERGARKGNTRLDLGVITKWIGTRCSVAGSGAMLQAGRSRFRFPMRSLDVPIALILPAAL